MEKIRDIELAYNFPDSISRKKRARLAIIGWLFLAFSLIIPIVLAFL